jgi:hypothetical protein
LACVVAPVASAAQWQHAPLLRALSLLTPPSYTVNVDRSIPASTVLRWTSEGDWQTRLAAAARSAGLEVQIDLTRHVITVAAEHAAPDRIQRVSLDAATSSASLEDSIWQAWRAPAPPMPAPQVRLIDAVETLMPDWRDPQGHTLGLEVLATDLDTPVRWDSTLSRWDALQDMLRSRGLSAQMRGRTLRVAPLSSTDARSRMEQAKATVSAPTAPPGLQLVAGQPIGAQLKKQAAAQGWTVVWNVDRDWIVPSNTRIDGAIDAAITSAVKAMAAQGAPIHAAVYTANHTIVIAQNGDHQ